MEAGQTPPPIRTQARSATILPNFIGLTFQVYNGKVYHDVTITEDMVGHKLGEFSPYVFLLCWPHCRVFARSPADTSQNKKTLYLGPLEHVLIVFFGSLLSYGYSFFFLFKQHDAGGGIATLPTSCIYMYSITNTTKKHVKKSHEQVRDIFKSNL